MIMGLFNNENKGEGKGGGLRQAFETAKPELNLSADQEQRIKEIFKGFREERQDLKAAGNDSMRNDLQAARQERRQKVMAVLNEEQKKILQAALQKLRAA